MKSGPSLRITSNMRYSHYLSAIVFLLSFLQTESFSIPSARRCASRVLSTNAGPTTNNNKMRTMNGSSTSTSSTSPAKPIITTAMKTTKTTSSTAPLLAMITLPTFLPPWAIYSLGHILGGTTGTPIVIRATKSWYKRIPLPPWTPPNFVFAPVWTTLYGLMGYSISRILKAGIINSSHHRTTLAIKLWTLHYALNLLWAPLFFGCQCLRAGFLLNILLVASLLGILPLFHAIDPVAAYLQLPYLVWLMYATKLNQAICRLNPMVGGVNEAMVQADLCADGEGYNDAMLQYDVKRLQADAARYAGL